MKTTLSLETKLTVLAEIAIKNYTDGGNDTNNAISMAKDLANTTDQIKECIDTVFSRESTHAIYLPVLWYDDFYPDFSAYDTGEEDRVSGNYEGTLFSIFNNVLYHEMLLSVDNGNVKRFVDACLNVNEVIKKDYYERVEKLNEQQTEILRLFDKGKHK